MTLGMAVPSAAARPVALVTGVSRSAGIGAAIVENLARAGWDIALTYWPAYDDRMPWRSNAADFTAIENALQEYGARTFAIETDLAQAEAIPNVFDAVEQQLAPATALVLVHCESVDSDIRSTTLDSFDRHMAVNARASWLLIREFATPLPVGVRLRSDRGTDQRPHGRQPRLRSKQRSARPHRPRVGPGTGRHRRHRQRHQSRSHRHGLDE